MPHVRLRHLALLAALVVSASCASTPRNTGAGTAGAKVTPPERLRSGPPPEIREVVDLRIEVLVDADGQPDMRTLKVTGKGSGSTRTAIADWIRSSAFKPAMQDGQPLAAIYRTGIKTSVQVRRM